MNKEKEMTAINTSAATEEQQPSQPDNSITENGGEIKPFDEDFDLYRREILRQIDPTYLETVTMPDLYNTVYEKQSGLIDGLLPRGTYLFVGSPKVGKSFMMAQLGYHISTGTPL